MEIEEKRDFLYSIGTILSAPGLLYYCSNVAAENPLTSIIEKNEIPVDTILLLGLSEFIKVFLPVLIYPGQQNHDLSPSSSEPSTSSSFYAAGGGRKSRNNSFTNSSSKSRLSILKPFEFIKGLVNFAFAIGICHLFLVLFGAPLIENWRLTLQFSVIITCWLFFPLCLVLRPASILTELAYISLWESQNSGLSRAKWRFIGEIFGIWIGSIVVPLDWDRPWQKWPIPCLLTAAATHLILSFCYFIYLILYSWTHSSSSADRKPKIF